MTEAEHISRQIALDRIIVAIRADGFTVQEIVERLLRDAAQMSRTEGLLRE